MKLVLVLVLIGVITAVILQLPQLAEKLPFSVSKHNYLNTQFNYQVLLLSLSLLVLLVLYVADRENLSTFLALGNIAAPAKKVSWLGIAENESWLRVGVSLSFFITLATATFVFLQFRKSAPNLNLLVPLLMWVLLFSLTNSFSEEVIYRLGVLVPLVGSTQNKYILLISAVAFGVAHFRGMPNGIVGMVMAGFLGWLLAKSVLETNGVLWAWLIHFLQDVVIFSAFVMSATSKPPG